MSKRLSRQFCFVGLWIVTFLFTGCGGSGGGDDTITITANNDTFSLAQATTTTLNLAANDTAANDQLDLTSTSIVTSPINGSIINNSDGTVNYTHNGSDTTADSFTYTIKGQSAATSNVATSSITITPHHSAQVNQVNIYHSTVVEGADDLEFVVSLSSIGSETISVNYATTDRSALAGADYTSTSGTLHFAPGENRKFITET